MTGRRWRHPSLALIAPALGLLLAAALLVAGCSRTPGAGPPRGPRNVIIFVADGLRHDAVNPADAPTLLSVRDRGVHFRNSHSLFPTLTTANAAALATGHYLGDTGIFSNTEFIGAPIFSGGNFGNAPGTPTPFLENDQVLADLDERFGAGGFMPEVGLLTAARAGGFNTAAIGKLGPAAIFDLDGVAARHGAFVTPATLVLDDSTGTPAGLPLPPAMARLLTTAGLSLQAPLRRQPAGDAGTAGTLESNAAQQQWLIDATTRAVLPEFVRSGRPFVIVYWSRDPDGSQHNQGDSLNRLVPGINGPTARRGVATADANLRQLLDYLQETPELRSTTDVFVTSDHGFATISKHEIDREGHATGSYSTRFTYRAADGRTEVVPGWLPPGFLAIDLAHALDLPLFDADGPLNSGGQTRYTPIRPERSPSALSRQRPLIGSALIGGATLPSAKVIVAANGGSDLIYIPDRDRLLVRRIVDFLSRQDYVGGLFVDSKLGAVAGALPLHAIGLEGVANLPRPAIVVAFRTYLREPRNLLSAVQIADSTLQEGQGSHGSLGRDNTFNNMAAFGPDFKQGFVDELPVSNADIAVTAARLLGLAPTSRGSLRGRILAEALRNGPVGVAPQMLTLISAPDRDGRATMLRFQQFQGRSYYDSACIVDVRRPPAPRGCEP